jgi:hypothetical protein
MDICTAIQLLPPSALVSTIESGGNSEDIGRKGVYFGWIVHPDGIVIPFNQYAQWLEGQLAKQQ